MAKFLIALDQSSQITGYSIWEGEKLIMHGHKTISGGDYIERIAKLRQWLAELIDEMGDVEVAIEDIQLQENENINAPGLQTYKKLAHAQGALLTLLAEKKIPYHIVMASSWKHTCGVKGRSRAAQKAGAQAFVKTTYAFDATEDEADAVCIGHHVIHAGLVKMSAF